MISRIRRLRLRTIFSTAHAQRMLGVELLDSRQCRRVAVEHFLRFAVAVTRVCGVQKDRRNASVKLVRLQTACGDYDQGRRLYSACKSVRPLELTRPDPYQH